MTDDALFEPLRSRLTTAVVGDVLDGMGFRTQFLPPGIGPLVSNTRLVGRAMPVLEADIFDDDALTGQGPLAGKPFGMMLEALDDLKPGEVYVATGGSLRYALWGELMATRALHLGAAGAVLDGYIRDADGIQALSFPAYGRGLYAQDQGPRGKVIDYRCRVEIGETAVLPGDLIFGDREGVLVIPQKVEQHAVEAALDKADAEGTVARAIREGMPATEAFAKYGVM